MVSYFADVNIIRFWPKTMDYSQAFCPKLSSIIMAFVDGPQIYCKNYVHVCSQGLPYSGLFSWGANFRYFRDSAQDTKFSTPEYYHSP